VELGDEEYEGAGGQPSPDLKTTTMQEKNRKFSPPITHIFASL